MSSTTPHTDGRLQQHGGWNIIFYLHGLQSFLMAQGNIRAQDAVLVCFTGQYIRSVGLEALVCEG